MAWYVLYDDATGQDLSVGSERPPEPGPGRTVRQYLRTVDTDAEEWDTATRDYRAKVPDVHVDRLADLEADPALAAVWQRLTVAQRQVLRDRLRVLLGRERFRSSAEPVNLP